MEIRLTKKQGEYVREAHHRWNFAVGAVRSGKSYLATLYTIPKRLTDMAGLKGLNVILGATRDNVERNVLAPMRQIWGEEFISDINTKNIAMIFGQPVYVFGAEKVSQVAKIRGSEIKFCYCDEVCDFNSDVFEMLKSRLSLPYSECHLACNPAGPNHFVKKFIDQAMASNGKVDIFYQHYTIYDNPFLPASYVSGLEAEYAGTVYYDRYILGQWAKAEGMIYPEWKKALEPKWEGDTRAYCISCDYGTLNAFHALKWKLDGQGVWHCVEEYRYSGREQGHQKTDEDYVSDLAQFCRDANESITVEVIVDPSAASFITALRRRGGFRVRTANNAVVDGIRDTAAAMEIGTIKIADNLEGLKEEFIGYVWDDREDCDKPIKVNDHGMDALRYFVRTKHVNKPKSEYTSPFIQNDATKRRFVL